ncbi:hypothetical protein ACFFRR_005027 [Megaselia abdita]
MLYRTVLTLLLITSNPDLINALKDVSVRIPKAVKKGDNALLICNYDMEDDTLYSVKWYKGRREFFRYTPKEKPSMKIFTHQGINVDQSESNESHVLLTSVSLNITGKFSCEVSADAPTFHTAFHTGEMEVVEIPEQRPIITGIHTRYRIGDNINGNCSSDNSKPVANLTWSINDIPVFHNYIKNVETYKNIDLNLESASTEINFIVAHQHFIRGRLKLKCTARIHDLYEQVSEKVIEEDRPRILASGRSPDNIYGDMSDGGNEFYLTHYVGKVFCLLRFRSSAN